MSYQDPYDQGQGSYDNSGNQGQGSYDNSGNQDQGDYGMDGVAQDIWQVQQSQDWSSQQDYQNQWTTYGDPGHKSRSNDYPQKGFDPKYGYSNYQYPPSRRPSQKDKPSMEVVPVPAIQVSQNAGMHNGFEKGEFTPKRRTPSAYREYRYNNQGNLWTKNGSLRTAGRVCLCTVLITLFLVVSIALSLVLWIRPPNIQIGQVQSSGGLQRLSNGGFQVNLSTVISVDNFNYFDVAMRKIEVDVFYPINNSPIGGGVANNILFKSDTETNFTFPFALTYNPSSDASGQVLADIATKCGVGGGQRSDISVNYQLTLGIQVLLFTLSPVISNVFTFPCPIKASDISKIFGGS